MIRWLPPALLLLAAVLSWPVNATAAGDPAGDASRGEALFASSCAMCHGDDATGMMGMHPALRGAVERLTLEGVEVTIRNGRDTRPPMPAFGDRLDDEDIADLIAYLETLPAGPRNFGPENSGGQGRDMGGMGGMGGTGGIGGVWIAAAVLIAALAAAVGYLLGQRR